MIRPLMALAAAVGLAAPVLAQPDPADFVSADARWLAHVDVDRLLGADLVRAVMDKEGVSFDSGEFADMKTALGLDPVTDVHAVTVYGTAQDPERAVAVVSGNVKLEQALDRLVMHMKREERAVGDLQLHHWSERDSNSGDELFTYVARRVDSDERLLLAGANADDVVHAARVVRGEAKGLSGSGSSLVLAPSPGAAIYVSASPELLDGLDVDAPDEVVKMVSSLRLEIGENAGNTFIDARLGVREAAQAQQIVAIGLTAAKVGQSFADTPMVFCQVYNFEQYDLLSDTTRGVDLLPCVLTHIGNPQSTIGAEMKPPRVAEAKRPRLGPERRMSDPRVVRRDRIA